VIVSVTITDSREHEIADALLSVVDHVDLVLLLDTGIKDGTVERAKEVAGDKLEIVKHKWSDFSTARNAGLKAAKALGATWTLIVDSDERLDFGNLDLRATLSNVRADSIRIEAADGSYPKEKIVRASSGAYFTGPTHETLIVRSFETLEGATFYELGKSHEQAQKKFERDIRLLTDYIKKHPDDPRWRYYLGASYEGIGAKELAAIAFGECVGLRKVGDEAAWAAYKQAEQLFNLELFDEAIVAAARGLSANAHFAECAWMAGLCACKLGRADQAIAWSRMAAAVGRYKGCGPERDWFRHMPALYELPYDVLRFVLPPGPERAQAELDFHAAKRARLGVSDNHELDRLSITQSNPRRFEARSMLRPPALSSFCPTAHNTEITFRPPNGWHPMNPSICWHKGELWCVVRTVNYSLNGREYTVHDPEGIVRTENYLGKLTPNVELVDHRLIRDLDRSLRVPSRIVGYEDIRLVSLDELDGNVLGASATVCDHDTDRRLIARLFFNDEGDVTRREVQPTNQMHEKNWMPLAIDGMLTWIYSLDPTAILPGPLRKCPFALEHLRGGAAIALQDGYLCVTHETIETDESRVYLHRFVRLDKKFSVIAVSPAWVFAGFGIEFCAGLALDNEQLVLSYGVRDREAWISQVDIKEIEAMKWIKP
jgi:tetratricopeptide (TPR) repeat protein